jgi:hypothetical protein
MWLRRRELLREMAARLNSIAAELSAESLLTLLMVSAADLRRMEAWNCSADFNPASFASAQ